MQRALPVNEVRVNARLTGDDAERFRELQRSEGRSASDLLREALRAYHAARRRPKASALALVTAAGFVGAGDGPADLSTRYKEYLSESLADKHPASRVHDRK